jgi:hypothetical protein
LKSSIPQKGQSLAKWLLLFLSVNPQTAKQPIYEPLANNLQAIGKQLANHWQMIIFLT